MSHLSWVTHIYVAEQTIIVSVNGLSPGRHQAIIWTNAGILLIGPLGTNFSGILIGIQTFSFKKMRFKVSSSKWRPFCLSLDVLRDFCKGHIWPLERWPILSGNTTQQTYIHTPRMKALLSYYCIIKYQWPNILSLSICSTYFFRWWKRGIVRSSNSFKHASIGSGNGLVSSGQIWSNGIFKKNKNHGFTPFLFRCSIPIKFHSIPFHSFRIYVW